MNEYFSISDPNGRTIIRNMRRLFHNRFSTEAEALEMADDVLEEHGLHLWLWFSRCRRHTAYRVIRK